MEELPPRWNRGGSCSCLRVAPCEAMREGTGNRSGSENRGSKMSGFTVPSSAAPCAKLQWLPLRH